ncbi:uncharacterized protein LOC129584248 [Paramacrobiotus metropolitanus]|uniref:uncharacterized protein LOC129584248 n=1 Tax=Paramacrobiotus metropolitanus TaxID=2943436 RepID=UPI0024459CD6|nr:uncharacterized protein LOC129584248 [Paramacrobiotus metropolitanus]
MLLVKMSAIFVYILPHIAGFLIIGIAADNNGPPGVYLSPQCIEQQQRCWQLHNALWPETTDLQALSLAMGTNSGVEFNLTAGVDQYCRYNQPIMRCNLEIASVCFPERYPLFVVNVRLVNEICQSENRYLYFHSQVTCLYRKFDYLAIATNFSMEMHALNFTSDFLTAGAQAALDWECQILLRMRGYLTSDVIYEQCGHEASWVIPEYFQIIDNVLQCVDGFSQLHISPPTAVQQLFRLIGGASAKL